jgi:hypothetical protein
VGQPEALQATMVANSGMLPRPHQEQEDRQPARLTSPVRPLLCLLSGLFCCQCIPAGPELPLVCFLLLLLACAAVLSCCP